ncbi:MAG TPA: hypothetical protein VKS22_16175 [Candidatus Binataceae bacterium]|nr:hypothetical protein [Candidatus Binataceae bacterium]
MGLDQMPRRRLHRGRYDLEQREVEQSWPLHRARRATVDAKQMVSALLIV